jgi:hypothetical protein
MNIRTIVLVVVAALLLHSCATTQTTPQVSNATLTSAYNFRLSKRVPIKEFSLEDYIVSIVDFTWPEPTRGGGEHLIEWRWYKDGVLVSQSERRMTFTSTPYTTWTTRAAGSLGIGHFSVATVLDGKVASSSDFEIKP